MKAKIYIPFVLILLVWGNGFSQHSYYYSRQVSLPPRSLVAPTVELAYPVNMENVKAIGMGNTQVALGRNFNAMMYNPALLGRKRHQFEILGFLASLPPATYQAAFFLKDNMNEFKNAVSLNQVRDGVDAFFAPDATIDQKLEALNQIQQGMRFSMELLDEVIGDAENPKRHGLTLLPAISFQYGNFGFSLYGFGHSGFVVHQSPTLEALMAIDLPADLTDPIAALKAVAQMKGVLATVLSQDETFVSEVFPVAFYLSYIDIVGALGYGFQIGDNWMVGANLKVVNRRFTTNRIPVVDYNKILSDAWKNLQANITGFTFDIGTLYRSPFGTSFGIDLQNIVPMKTISQSVDTEFRFPQIYYDRDQQGNIITNALGDTALVSAYRQTTITRPFDLKAPLLVNFGFSQAITSHWDIALDWVDITEQDSRFESSSERIRLGTEYRFNLWHDNLILSLRSGINDKKFSLGLGLDISHYLQLDGAYAYDQFVKTYSYFTQLRIGW